MEISQFAYGDADRIFVNTDMGCNAECKYCYLSSLKIVHGTRKINAAQAIELVQNLKYYTPGEDGSIISIGCYSECMDKDNVKDTVDLVKYFVKKGNTIQLATKKKIEHQFFEEITKCPSAPKKLWIYVSLPVIINHNLVERGTDLPSERIKNFDLCKEYGINSALYIKPYIKGITNQNVFQYCELAWKYNIPVIVGQMLSTNYTEKQVLVGENRLFEHTEKDMDSFIRELQKYTDVYLHSTECIKNTRI